MKVNKDNKIWLVEACQVQHTIGIFETLEKAHNAICKECAPNSPLRQTKKYMPLHRYEDDNTKSEYYLIWDETDGDWYKDAPMISISQLKLGKTYKYSAKKKN
jgi:hypothetical protein